MYNVSYSLGQYLERPVVQVVSHKVKEEELGWRKILEELVNFLLKTHFALSYATLELLLNTGGVIRETISTLLKVSHVMLESPLCH